MYDHHIQDMANQLVCDGLIAEEKKWEAIASLSKHWQDKIALVWCAEDVTHTAEEMGRDLSEDQVREVLDNLLHYHDAEYGVCWENIRYQIREV